jgi:RepB DNA-primase from phage plasmid
MNLKPAQEFLTRCFAPEETIALLFRSEATAKVTQRIVTVKQAIAPRYLGWLAYENTNGANIYVAANPLRSGSRKRTKESIASVRHIYIDVDTDGKTRIATVQSSDLVPAPTIVLSTSPGKYQALWRVDGFDLVSQEDLLKHLAIAFGGDPACTDCNRVLRVPGFLNRKYDPAHLVTAEYFGDSVYKPSDFRLPMASLDSVLSDGLHLTPKRPRKHSTSENDWAWVSRGLADGRDAAKLTKELASRRSDKPNPLYYAQRTVDVASARLWMLEGVPHEDIVTMLESRRRFEISTTLCSARAREITATAARMMARKRIA